MVWTWLHFTPCGDQMMIIWTRHSADSIQSTFYGNYK